MKGRILAFATLCAPFFINAQITGKVIDKVSNEAIIGAKIIGSDGAKAVTDFEGNFKLNSQKFPVTLITTMIQYMNDTLVIQKSGDIVIKLSEPIKDLGPVVVSAGKRRQAIEEIPVSMEIIRPELIDNKGISNLEQAVNQTPGVFTMDGQVSIRGGSGFAYGTGSRVLLLWNGMPLLSGYAGDTQWNAIPMEQASQVEVMKGAASVLYGSGALNGVISLQEKEPGLKPETKVKVQYGIYDNPARASLKWWSRSPMNQQIEAFHGQMYKKMGYTISTTLFHNDGFRQGEKEFRGRVSGTIYLKPEKHPRFKAGIGYNYQIQKTGTFLIWYSDTLGYTPSGGADTSNPASTLTYSLGQRLFIDPYIKFIDKKNNKHTFKNRVYYANNEIINNPNQSNGAVIFFSDYQVQKQFNNGIVISTGASNIYNVVNSKLFGNHTSANLAGYFQYEHKIGKLDITAGLRAEYFEMDGKRGDSNFKFKKTSSKSIPVYPVLRTGIHYEIAKYTHFRASIGQGIRYPSVSERYTQTSVGALNIFPNPDLKPEVGWAGEIGLKQGVKIGDWKGMFDIAAFVNQYNNMVEFTFGAWNPDSIALSTDPNSPGYINKWVGFIAQNAESARITGIDLSFNSFGSIGKVEIISLIGYTYMNPISLNNDSLYRSNFSDPNSNLLKYRFKHLAKADIEANYKHYSIGFSARYNSFMSNIDRIFEESIVGTFILPGLKEYRQVYNKGNLVFDMRLAYKINDNYRVSFIANNILNAEYTTRPGDIQPPRNFIMQVQMKF
ncbi:MAG: TonB-dependent receptor [Flavobacteriales bacterium]|nr:TonB-dependent receptor [Flavobacteriales bacterium]NCA20461.1 TonB-dependent receptor [Crocinitomicaceae bacterium]